MAITVKHNKVSTVPDGDDTSVVRPSDWNADHTLVGTIDVANGGTGASTLTGYVKGNGTSAMTANATIPSGDVSGLGTMSTQNANAVAITGGTINNTSIGATTPSTGAFTTLTASGATTLGANGSNNQTFVASAGTGAFPNIVTSHQSGIARLAASYPTGNSSLMLSARGTGGSVRLVTNLYTDEQVRITHTGSSVNYINMTGAATGSDPVISAQGSDSNIDLVLSPKGTGALQAQLTDSTTAGGNARGANAVDWQTLRSTASMVASSTGSVIVGGQNNTSSSYTSFVGAGANNFAQTSNSFVGGGNANVVNQNGGYASIVGGNGNTASGYSNFIGGGFTNAGTSGSAVTTQSGTMNATTAVTLSGSNANIKVGQYITGTSIAGETYVAAISGTSLTLSKVASGSSTSTLSFFTPHGVVVGGGNNQATGAYSFIGGGGDAGTAANRNVASGDWSVVVGGIKNLASGIASFVGGGGTDGSTFAANTASGTASAIVGGYGNNATGTYSTVAGGLTNTASGSSTIIMGGRYGSSRGINGMAVIPACANPITTTLGNCQSAILVLGVQTTDATATALKSDSNAVGSANQVILPNNSAYFFRGEVISGVTGGGNTKGWTIEGVIKRGANAASTALVGTPTVTSTYADAGASTWVIAVTADTTNGGIRVTFTGQAATTIRTVCRINTVEMTF